MLKFAKWVQNALSPIRVNFYSFNEAMNMTAKWADTLPSDFDVVIGIPRSGLFIANMIALKFGKPLSTPDNFIQGEIWHTSTGTIPKKIEKVLLVEDAVRYGRVLTQALKQLKKFDANLTIKVASFIVRPEALGMIDYYLMPIEPRVTNICEWTLLSCQTTGKLDVDMDGVLCKECTPEIDADEVKYIDWLKSVEPHMIPNFQFEAIITSRLEKYRPQTEAWLKEHGVKYKSLMMMDLNDKSAKTFKNVVAHKVRCIKQTKPYWFWESNIAQANAIHRKTGKPVLCVDKTVMVA